MYFFSFFPNNQVNNYCDISLLFSIISLIFRCFFALFQFLKAKNIKYFLSKRGNILLLATQKQVKNKTFLYFGC